MKTAVSIPDELFEQADRFAERTGRSRSQLYAEALAAFLSESLGSSVTAALDDVYADGPADAGAGVRAARVAIARGDWEW
jgi:predicted transcriptional regulator